MKKSFDVVIIGGGAAGMMAAISAKRHHPEKTVAIVDRTFALGRKILVCGAGRCNITNVNLDTSIEDHYYGATPEFVGAIFDQFGYKDIVAFFEELGIELYVERKTDIGKLFPITNQAKTVTELMLDEIERLGIEVFLNHEVVAVNEAGRRGLLRQARLPARQAQDDTSPSVRDSVFQLKANEIEKTGKVLNKKEFTCANLILSAGGRSYPALGSDGSGYKLAEKMGHKIIDPVPSALPLKAKSKLSHLLQGQKMEVEVTSIINDKEIKTRTDDVMFTKYGLSGPAILNISREISIHFNREKKNNCYVALNFLPGINDPQRFFYERWKKRPEQTLEKSLFGLFPNKIARAIVQHTGLDPDTKVQDLKVKDTDQLIDSLIETKIKIDATRGWNEAEFTAGGIDSKDIKAKTLESEKAPGLYICGEILDVDGDVGGFNLSWSWSSGFVVGKLG